MRPNFLKRKTHPLLHQAVVPMKNSGERGGRRIIAAVLVALVALGTWAALANIEELARARGQVIAAARTQVIQAADGGVLEAMLVREGEPVRQGQILARLERSRAEAATEDSRAKVAALRAALARLKAEVFGGTPAFGPELESKWAAFVANQKALFTRRQQALREGVGALEKTLVIVRAELAITEPLEAAGDVGRAEVLRLQRQEAELLGQIVNIRNKYFQDAQAEMTKAEEDLSTQEQMLAERSTLLEHTELRAPMDGVVKRIQITTIGAAVRPGDTLLELLPGGTDFIVEAKFAPTDVAFLRLGLPAAVKLDAYDSSIYGQATGEVVYISPDAITEPDPRTGEHVYYRVHVRIASLPDKLVRGKPMLVQPGMTALVEVRTGERTVLQYLTKPVVKTLSEAMTER